MNELETNAKLFAKFVNVILYNYADLLDWDVIPQFKDRRSKSTVFKYVKDHAPKDKYDLFEGLYLLGESKIFTD